MAKLAKSRYTQLLKNKHIKRSEINLKKNTENKRKIIRQLAQSYAIQTHDSDEVLKLIRQHGIKIPRDISRDLWSYSGVRFAETPDIERKQIEYGKRLAGNVLPKESKIFKSTSFVKGSYVYIVETKGYSSSSTARNKNRQIKRTILLQFDRPVTKQEVLRTFEMLLDNEDMTDTDFIEAQSPILDKLLTDFEIKKWRVVGLMKGV